MLVKHLKRKYGKPDSPSEYRKKLKDRKGIIIFEVHGWSDATDHADLWDGNKCLWKGYGNAANKVLFWQAESTVKKNEKQKNSKQKDSVRPNTGGN